MHTEDYFGLESIEAHVAEANHEFVDAENELWREGREWQAWRLEDNLFCLQKVSIVTPWAMGVEDGM